MLSGGGGRSPRAVRIARLIFGIAAFYGLAVLAFFYFAEPLYTRHDPPGLSHPEHYYGFLGAAAVMQLVYLAIARDPLRFRPLMPIAVLAKLVFFATMAVLFAMGRTEAATLAGSTPDLLIGLAFAFAWLQLPSEPSRG